MIELDSVRYYEILVLKKYLVRPKCLKVGVLGCFPFGYLNLHFSKNLKLSFVFYPFYYDYNAKIKIIIYKLKIIVLSINSIKFTSYRSSVFSICINFQIYSF